MPYEAFSHFTDKDGHAVAAFLQALKPVSHQVPGPWGPGETVPVFIMRTLPPGQIAAKAP